MLYREQHGMNRAQVDSELEKMEDRNLVAAILYYSFNQHHDGGYHLTPSNYLTNNAYHAPFILYAQLKLAGQASHGLNSIKDIARARRWVEEFWLERLPKEEALLKKFKEQNGARD